MHVGGESRVQDGSNQSKSLNTEMKGASQKGVKRKRVLYDSSLSLGKIRLLRGE